MEGDTFTDEVAVGDEVPKVPDTSVFDCMEGMRGLWLPGLA